MHLLYILDNKMSTLFIHRYLCVMIFTDNKLKIVELECNSVHIFARSQFSFFAFSSILYVHVVYLLTFHRFIIFFSVNLIFLAINVSSITVYLFLPSPPLSVSPALSLSVCLCTLYNCGRIF